jgi:hypothetical protein
MYERARYFDFFDDPEGGDGSVADSDDPVEADGREVTGAGNSSKRDISTFSRMPIASGTMMAAE